MGLPFPEVELSLCEALEDETYAKDVMERGLPVGEFPTKCPIKAVSLFLMTFNTAVTVN